MVATGKPDDTSGPRFPERRIGPAAHDDPDPELSGRTYGARCNRVHNPAAIFYPPQAGLACGAGKVSEWIVCKTKTSPGRQGRRF
jgi:hypothetical protein